jgi:glucose/arabinose dehydrogenase
MLSLSWSWPSIALGALALLACGDNTRRPGSGVDAGADAPGDAGPTSCPREGDKVRAQLVANVSGAATLVASPPGDPRLFVLEQEGRIRIIEDGRLLPEPFLDLRDNAGGPVQAGGEQGLLGLAFPASFADSGTLYVYYTTRTATVVASYRVSAADRNRGDAASRQVLLSMPDRFANHNGGMIEFGADGLLYIATGDGGSANDPDDNGQDRFSLLGKMLRIDVERPAGGQPYRIPADNPFADGVGGAPEVYMVGLRNPWRWSFDEGAMFIADVGQDRHEELNIVPASQARGADLGWDVYEANRCGAGTCDPAGRFFPQLVGNHGAGAGNGWCSIIGGAVYRGSCSPGLVGRYYYTDYCKGGLFSLRWTGSEIVEQRQEDGDFPSKASSINRAFGGELYLTTTDGGVFRLEARR